MNNKPKSKSNLWFLFVVIVLAAMLVTFVVIGAVMALLFALDVIPAQQQFAPLPFMMLIIVSIVIGTGISLIVGRSILQPIGRLSDALDTVAKGDFSIRLDEKTKVREISRMYENFNAMTRELSGIETLRSDFIANVSRDTPLSCAIGSLQRNKEKTIWIKSRATRASCPSLRAIFFGFQSWKTKALFPIKNIIAWTSKSEKPFFRLKTSGA